MGDGLTSCRPQHMGEAARLQGKSPSTAQDNAIGYSDTTVGTQELGSSSRSSSSSSSSSSDPTREEAAGVKPKRVVRIAADNATFSGAAGRGTSLNSNSDSDEGEDDNDNDSESLLAACQVPGCGEILSLREIDYHEDMHRAHLPLAQQEVRANDADEADEPDQANESLCEKANDGKRGATRSERIAGTSSSTRRTKSRGKADNRLRHSSSSNKEMAASRRSTTHSERLEFGTYVDREEVLIARSRSMPSSPDMQDHHKHTRFSADLSHTASRTRSAADLISPMRHASINEESDSRREPHGTYDQQQQQQQQQQARYRSRSRHTQSRRSQSRRSQSRHSQTRRGMRHSFSDDQARSSSVHDRDSVRDNHRDRRREQRERSRQQHDRPHSRNYDVERERDRGRDRDSEQDRGRDQGRGRGRTSGGTTVTQARASSSHRSSRLWWALLSGLHPEPRRLVAIVPRADKAANKGGRSHDWSERPGQHARPPALDDNTTPSSPAAALQTGKHPAKKQHQRLGKDELGKYAHEDRMPDGLVIYLNNEWGIDRAGIIPAMRQLLELSPTTRYAYLCDPCVHHVSRLPKEGGFCGYRNIQTMSSYIIGARFSGHKALGDRLPSIFDIQNLIENAWDMGINAGGRIETGGIRLTRKYIGTPEALALFQSIKVPCSVQAFNHRKFGRATEMLVHDVEQYFCMGQSEGERKVRCTTLPPIYLQHPGHSLTIVGVEKTKTGDTNLLVFDPMFKNGPPITQLVDGRRIEPRTADKLLKMYRRGPRYLNRFRAFEILKLTPRAKDIADHAKDAATASQTTSSNK